MEEHLAEDLESQGRPLGREDLEERGDAS